MNIIKGIFADRKKAFAALFVLALVLELTVFNYRTWRAAFYSLTNEEMRTGSQVSISKATPKINIEDINREIKNIYIDIECSMPKSNPPDEKVKTVLHVTDEGNSKLFALPMRYIVCNVESTKYIPLELAGKTDKLEIEFVDLNNKTYFVKDIYINKVPPFSFNILRLLLVFAFFAVLYILRVKSGFFAAELNLSSAKQIITVTLLTCGLCVFFVLLCFSNYQWSKGTVSHQLQYNELADAFARGHFYLNEEPSDALKSIENPYDTNARNEYMTQQHQVARWDHAYFQGKYYVYFGVVPELLLYYPAKVLFNYTLRNNEAIAIMGVWFIPAAFWLVYLLIKRTGVKVPFVVYCLMSVVFVWGCGIMRAGAYADMYHVPIVSGLTLTVLGLAIMLYASTIGEKWTKKPVGTGLLLFFGALCLALVAGCRPQMVLGSFLLIPIFWDKVFKERKLFSKEGAPQTVFFVLPYVAVAAFLMYYNYARFGSAFDFGANYNLTTNDMTVRGFRLARIPLGIFTYLFQPPSVHAEFPFFHSPYVFTSYQGTTIKESMAGGVFITNCFLLAVFLIPKAKEYLKKMGMLPFVLMSAVFGVVIAIADAQMAGLLERYTMDFNWLFFMAAIVVFAAMIEKFRALGLQNLIYKVISVSFLFSMIFNVLNIFLYGQYGFSESTPQLHYAIYYALCFWM